MQKIMNGFVVGDIIATYCYNMSMHGMNKRY